MKRYGKFRWTLLPIFILIIFFSISLVQGINEFPQASQTAGMNTVLGWKLENGWTVDGSEFIGSGPGRATYNESCSREPLTFKFKLKSLEGGLSANININGSNYYAIRFFNGGNGSLNTSFFKVTGVRGRFERSYGQPTLYDPTREYQIEIYSNAGHIQVVIRKIPGQESVAMLPVIDFNTSNPLPPGNISLETIEGSIASVYDMQVNCSSQSQNEELPNLGVGYFKRPHASELINSSWGEVPADQVMVVVGNESKFEDARKIARDLAAYLNGSVVGEFECINLFQIETNSQNLSQLIDDLFRSKAYPSIKLAFPNEQVFLESYSLNKSIYSPDRSKGYELIGATEAWDKINASKKELSEVQVGITDDGLYRGFGEFSGVVQINTTAPSSNLTGPKPEFKYVGSHGTGVMNVLAADPDNGGIVGIASEPLREKLKVTMINIFPDDRSFVTDSLLGLKEEIEGGCSILSCSWGDSNAQIDTVYAYNDFFETMYRDYPCLLFVCSAGNDGSKLDGDKRIPNGIPSSNMITVGNVWNNGTREPHSNMNNDTGIFQVNIAAPGDQAVWGCDREGHITASLGGTSMATPHITAAAAIIRSLNPDLNANDITKILETPNGNPGPNELGGCILNIYKAVGEVLANPPCNQCKKCAKISAKVDVQSSGATVGTETRQPAEGELKVKSFTFTPNPVCAGDTTKMSWTTSGAIGATITPGIGTVEPSGFRILSPVRTMGYTIRAWNNSTNSEQKTVLLSVDQNCMVDGSPSRGQTTNVVYDFIENAHDQGLWLGGPVDEIFQFGSRSEYDKKGSAMWKYNCLLNDMSVAARVLQVTPSENGYTTGTYRYMNYVVDPSDHLVGRVGFTNDAYAGNVTFSINLIEGNVNHLLWQRPLAYNEGMLVFDIPMSYYAGWRPAISLRVDSNGPSLQDKAVWQDVKIIGSSQRPVLTTTKPASNSPVTSDVQDWNPSGNLDTSSSSNVDWLNRP